MLVVSRRNSVRVFTVVRYKSQLAKFETNVFETRGNGRWFCFQSRYGTTLFFHQIQCGMFRFQGRPGEKGQKGELGSPGFDVFSAVKVSSYVI